jgi:hypothetical protein
MTALVHSRQIPSTSVDNLTAGAIHDGEQHLACLFRTSSGRPSGACGAPGRPGGGLPSVGSESELPPIGLRPQVPERVSFGSENDNEYEWNIQTADLNMMNAAMAVIKWKKLFDYYMDDKREFHSTYTVSRNQMASGEIAE